MNETISRGLVITGFHRSATSATSNYLKNSGLDIGSNLMISNISNVKGHFEDLAVVDIHDSKLRDCGTSWQFHGEIDLNVNSDFLANYIQRRRQTGVDWGVKDPRACLFLEQWNEQLGDDGAFLLIARHWSSCIESLLNRHSREFAFKLPLLDNDNPFAKFWVQPDLAAKMWLAYNKRLVNFAKTYPEKVIVCTQRSLFEGAPLLSMLNSKFSLTLNESADIPYQQELLNDSACESIEHSLSSVVKSELESVWHQLLTLADAKSENEQPSYYSAPQIASQFETEYRNSIETLLKEEDRQKSEYQTKKDIDNLTVPEDLTEQQFISWVKSNKTVTSSRLLDVTLLNYPLSSEVMLAVGRRLQESGCYEQALTVYQLAHSIDTLPPFVFMLMGQCCQKLNNSQLALHFFERALNGNPNNPAFFQAKANYLFELGETQKAKDCLDSGLNKLGHQPAIVLSYARLLMQEEHPTEAINLLENVSTKNEVIQTLLETAKMQKDYRTGLASYHRYVADYLRDKDKIQWLAKTARFISSASAEKDFIARCYSHWENLEK